MTFRLWRCFSFEIVRCYKNCHFSRSYVSNVEVVDMAAPSLIPRPGSSWTAASLFSPQPHSSPLAPTLPHHHHHTYAHRPTNKNSRFSYSQQSIAQKPFQSSYLLEMNIKDIFYSIDKNSLYLAFPGFISFFLQKSLQKHDFF